jgi:hypothetical protein
MHKATCTINMHTTVDKCKADMHVKHGTPILRGCCERHVACKGILSKIQVFHPNRWPRSGHGSFDSVCLSRCIKWLAWLTWRWFQLITDRHICIIRCEPHVRCFWGWLWYESTILCRSSAGVFLKRVKVDGAAICKVYS